MTTKEIANRLVEFNKKKEYQTAYTELFVDDVVSIENWGEREEYKGMDAVKAKGEKW